MPIGGDQLSVLPPLTRTIWPVTRITRTLMGKRPFARTPSLAADGRAWPRCCRDNGDGPPRFVISTELRHLCCLVAVAEELDRPKSPLHANRKLLSDFKLIWVVQSPA